jgi:hypothetical protein
MESVANRLPLCYCSVVNRVGVVFFVALVGFVSDCLATGFVPDARADDHDPYDNEDEYTEFYTPPNPLPSGRPGDLVRTEPSRLVLEPSGQLGAIMATGTRVMYRSTDARGNPDVVTGAYFEPYNDWPGRGPRPLIAYGPGTQGQGDQCADRHPRARTADTLQRC